MSKQIKDISFTYHSVRGRHKIQLLTYSSNVQRARLKLNSHWKVSVSQKKKRELGNRHLMHVWTLLNTIDIQAHPTRANCGKPAGRQTVVESSLVVILINTYMNDNNKCNIGRKKKGETHRIGSALRQGEVRLLHHVTVFTFDDVMPLADHCSICSLHFWWRDVKAISPKPTSKHDDSPQHRNISCNAKEFNVQIERLMFCKAIRHNATPFLRTLCYSTLPWAIWRNATPFVYCIANEC